MKFLILFSLLFSLGVTLSVTTVDSAPTSSSWLNLVPHGTFNNRQCMICRFSVSLVHYALQTKRGSQQVSRIANNFCSRAQIESPAVCSSITQLFNHEIIKVLQNGVVTPNQICGYLSNNTCGHFHDPMSDWEVNLNVSVTLGPDELSKRRLIQDQLRSPQKPYKVIHISDTHIDLEYQEGAFDTCNEPLCCRNTSTPTPSISQSRAGHWGSYGHCDVPLKTLESALKVLNQTIQAQPDIAYIVWTGDIQPHDVWAQNRNAARNTYSQVFEKIFQHLPNVRIFPTLGNHEMVPTDSFSPSNMLDIAKDDSPEWLYKELDGFWSRWLPNDTFNTIARDGFYATTVQTGLKIISLNTNFCHNKNFWLYINATDPGNQLQWLIHELQISEFEHEQVHIIGHIPPGSEDCLKVWSKNYNRILRRFSHTVGGQFFGHTHMNEFEIFYDKDSPSESTLSTSRKPARKQIQNPGEIYQPISVAHIGPSITTFIGLNPSFRIYNIDPAQSYMPTDFETYFMNLTAANLKSTTSPDEQPDWKSAGWFSKIFDLPDSSPASMHKLVVSLAAELRAYEIYFHTQFESIDAAHRDRFFLLNIPAEPPMLSDKLYQLYRLVNTYSDHFERASFDAMTLDAKKKFLCKFLTGQSHNLFACDHYMIGEKDNNQIDLD